MNRYCQTRPPGEQEIIEAILAPIGLLRAGECAVDIGAADGAWFSNTKFLEERFGYRRYLFDGDNRGNPEVIEARFTVENVNRILGENGVPDEFAVLSLDIDGFDYWLRAAMTARPILTIMEFQGTLDPLIPVTIPYDPNWSWRDGEGNYFGASWSAIKKVNEEKGYRYVTQCGGLNAFFIRDDFAHVAMPWNFDPPPVYKYHKQVPGKWLPV